MGESIDIFEIERLLALAIQNVASAAAHDFYTSRSAFNANIDIAVGCIEKAIALTGERPREFSCSPDNPTTAAEVISNGLHGARFATTAIIAFRDMPGQRAELARALMILRESIIMQAFEA